MLGEAYTLEASYFLAGVKLIVSRGVLSFCGFMPAAAPLAFDIAMCSLDIAMPLILQCVLDLWVPSLAVCFRVCFSELLNFPGLFLTA